MPIVTDYHWHTPLCKHAAGPLEAYVETGIARGFRKVGFSDHCPLPRGLGGNVRMDEDQLDQYVADVVRLRDCYQDQITVRLGLELDYVEGLESYCQALVDRYPWDYIIGSIHYLDPECRQGSWPRNFAGDSSALYARYFALLRQMVATGLCDIVAHFDVPKRSGRPPTRREESTIAETLADIADAGLCLEINTSGFRHPELRTSEPYPSFQIISQAIALGIPLTVNSDAHAPNQVGLKFDVVEESLTRQKCRALAEFSGRQRTMMPL